MPYHTPVVDHEKRKEWEDHRLPKSAFEFCGKPPTTAEEENAIAMWWRELCKRGFDTR